jgi:L-threonylcarbamoyladenylate synthase
LISVFCVRVVPASGQHLVVSGQPSFTPRILPTHTPALFDAAVAEAVRLLRDGQVVVLPTETVYGLAANALNPAAVARVFAIKGRPAHNPIIVHVVGQAMARSCAAHWPDAALRLADAFWPGPLTLVVKRGPAIPEIVTAGGTTVGLRWPSHPFIQAVIRACDFPLAAPSANPSNQLSPTNVRHVQKHLGRQVPLIIDGGQSQVGIESTVVDVTGSLPLILRPGMISLQSVLAVTGSVGSGEHAAGHAATQEQPSIRRSPGLLEKHYAPHARLLVLTWNNDDDLRTQLTEAGISPADCHFIAHTKIPSVATAARVAVIPHDAEAYARALYAELHRCDEDGGRNIIVETVPDGAEWKGIADRLRRAAAGSGGG